MLTVNTVSEESRLSIKYMKEWDTVIVRGRSTRLDVSYAYFNLIEKCKKHLQVSEELKCYFFSTIVNATKAKLLFNLFKVLEKGASSGKEITINWLVEENDEDLMSLGFDFKSLLNLQFLISQK